MFLLYFVYDFIINRVNTPTTVSKFKIVGPVYTVAQLKLGQLTFLIVTFECIGKIQYILVNVITVIQAHTLGSIKV